MPDTQSTHNDTNSNNNKNNSRTDLCRFDLRRVAAVYPGSPGLGHHVDMFIGDPAVDGLSMI